MKKILDKLKKIIKSNKKGLTFLLGISIIGFISGTFFIIIISKSDQMLVKEYIESFITNISLNKINYLDLFKNTIISNLSFIFIIWILGMSVIGIPINIFYYFIKSFMLGFSITSFILCYKIKGCLLSLVYVIPHNLLNIFVYTILMLYSIKFSLKLIDSIFNKKSLSFKNIMNTYLSILLISTTFILITALYETFAVPFIIKKLLFLI